MTRHSPSTYAYLAPIQWFIGFEYVLTHIWIIAHHITLRSMHDLKVHRVRLTPDGFGRHSASIICVTSLAAEKSSVHEERPSQKKKKTKLTTWLVPSSSINLARGGERRKRGAHLVATSQLSLVCHTPLPIQAQLTNQLTFSIFVIFFFSYFVFRTPPS